VKLYIWPWRLFTDCSAAVVLCIEFLGVNCVMFRVIFWTSSQRLVRRRRRRLSRARSLKRFGCLSLSTCHSQRRDRVSYWRLKVSHCYECNLMFRVAGESMLWTESDSDGWCYVLKLDSCAMDSVILKADHVVFSALNLQRMAATAVKCELFECLLCFCI